MPVPYSAAADALDEYRQRREEREMREALEADGKYLSQMTGQDHGPEFLEDCAACDGSGVEVFGITVYEPGCGFPHESTDERPCRECSGAGFFIVQS